MPLSSGFCHRLGAAGTVEQTKPIGRRCFLLLLCLRNVVVANGVRNVMQEDPDAEALLSRAGALPVDQHAVDAVERKLSEQVPGTLMQVEESHDEADLDGTLGSKIKESVCGELSSKVASTEWMHASGAHSFDSKHECAEACPGLCLSRQRAACSSADGKGPGGVTCIKLNDHEAGAAYCTEERERADDPPTWYSNCYCLVSTEFRPKDVHDAMQDELVEASVRGSGSVDLPDPEVAIEKFLLTKEVFKPEETFNKDAWKPRKECLNKCDEHLSCWYFLTPPKLSNKTSKDIKQRGHDKNAAEKKAARDKDARRKKHRKKKKKTSAAGRPRMISPVNPRGASVRDGAAPLAAMATSKKGSGTFELTDVGLTHVG